MQQLVQSPELQLVNHSFVNALLEKINYLFFLVNKEIDFINFEKMSLPYKQSVFKTISSKTREVTALALVLSGMIIFAINIGNSLTKIIVTGLKEQFFQI